MSLQEHSEKEQEFSFKKLFVPLTTLKATHVIIIMGLIVFANILFNSFVLDDISQVVTNISVHSLSNINDILLNTFRAQEFGSYYRPIPYLFYAFIYSFFQGTTFFYHFPQLIFHIANSILLLFIFKRYIKIGLTLFFALIFLVHPINQSTVAYIANLQDVLFVFFGLISFYLLQQDSKKPRYIIFSNIFLFLSLLSKETGIVFFILNFVYVYLFKRNKLYSQILYSAIIGILYLIMRFTASVPLQKEAGIPIMGLPFWERMINVPQIIFYYIQTVFYPSNLAALHSWVITNISPATFFLPLFYDLVFFAILIFITRYLIKKDKKIVLFFFLWFVLGLVLHLHIIPIDETVADRFFYFPFIGLLAFFGLFIQEIKIRKTFLIYGIFLGVVILSILSVRTIARNMDWKNQSTLISHDIKISKNDYVMEYLYGIELMQQNKNSDALFHTKKAIELYPESWHAWNSLGIIYSKQGDFTHAKDAYLHSISLKKYNGAYENFAFLLLKYEEPNKAKDFIVEANKLFPNSEKLWYDRIVVENKLGNYDEALNASKYYYLLKRDKKSYAIYQSLLQKVPSNIEQ